MPIFFISYKNMEEEIKPIKHDGYSAINKVDTSNPPRQNNHGGARPGAGRKKKEPTTTIRVPVSLVPKIKAFIKNAKD